MLSEEQKQQILCPLSSNKSSLLRVSGSISEKIIDWQQTKVINWLWKMVKERQKQQILCPLSSSKSSLLRVSTFISEKLIDWHQKIMIKLIWKDVEWRTKTANIVPTVFEQKFAFETFGLHFWENNWLTSNNNDQNDWKRCWVKNKNRKYWAHCLRVKVCFWEPRPTFLRI